MTITDDIKQRAIAAWSRSTQAGMLREGDPWMPIAEVLAAAERVVEAARRVSERKFSTYKTRNGRDVGIEGDDGEKCYIVHSEETFALDSALKAYDLRKSPV